MTISLEQCSVVATYTEDQVARERSAKQKINAELVGKFLNELKAAGTDRAAFDDVVERLQGSDELKSPDLCSIATRYAVAGKKPSSRDAALSKIKKRFVELIRTEGNSRVAAKARPW